MNTDQDVGMGISARDTPFKDRETETLEITCFGYRHQVFFVSYIIYSDIEDFVLTVVAPWSAPVLAPVSAPVHPN
jgi:hypothetical protein